MAGREVPDERDEREGPASPGKASMAITSRTSSRFKRPSSFSAALRHTRRPCTIGLDEASDAGTWLMGPNPTLRRPRGRASPGARPPRPSSAASSRSPLVPRPCRPVPFRPAFLRPALLVPALLLPALLLPAPPPAPDALAAPRTREIRADGRWSKFEIRAPEEVLAFLFEASAGCRYRLTVRCETLPGAPRGGDRRRHAWTADSRPPDDAPPGPAAGPAGSPALPLRASLRASLRRPPPGPPRDCPPAPPAPPVPPRPLRPPGGGRRLVRRGQHRHGGEGPRLLGHGREGADPAETLGPDGSPVAIHRRLLAPGGTLAQVGALWVDEANLWELVVEPGRAYQVRTRPGTAGPICLAVRRPEGEVIASTGPTPDLPYPTLSFDVPAVPAGEIPAGPPAGGARARRGRGTYGVRLHEGAAPPVDGDPPAPAAPAPEIPGAPPGPAAPGRLAFRRMPATWP